MNLFRRKGSPPSEATLARKQAERDLAQVRSETPRYRALGRSLAEMVEENHLAAALTSALRGER